MKNIFKLILLLLALISSAHAQGGPIVWPSDMFTDEGQMITSNIQKQPARIAKGTAGQVLVVGTNGYPAFASSSPAFSSTLPNNTFLKARNAADDADLNVLKVDTSNRTTFDSTGSILVYVDSVLEMQFADNLINFFGVTPVISSAGFLQFTVGADSNRRLTFDASSDTALTLQFGDSGTTAAQTFTLSGNTSDADDDSILNLASGGATGITRGAYSTLAGNESSDSGAYRIFSGNFATADVSIAAQDDFIVETLAGTDALVIDTATGVTTLTELTITGTPTSTGVLCRTAGGTIGQCTSVVGAGGTCTCS